MRIKAAKNPKCNSHTKQMASKQKDMERDAKKERNFKKNKINNFK